MRSSLHGVADAKVHCANPGAVIGAVDFNGAWIAMSSVMVVSNANRLRWFKSA